MRGALSTDLYELTMAAGYHAAADDTVASFELFVRELPVNRAYLVSAGLEEALDFLCDWHFTADDIAYLRSIPGLSGASSDFFDVFLPGLRFTGDVWAVTEGLPVFAGEPLLRVRAPLAEAQLVETALLAIILFQTSVASKASTRYPGRGWTIGGRVLALVARTDSRLGCMRPAPRIWPGAKRHRMSTPDIGSPSRCRGPWPIRG